MEDTLHVSWELSMVYLRENLAMNLVGEVFSATMTVKRHRLHVAYFSLGCVSHNDGAAFPAPACPSAAARRPPAQGRVSAATVGLGWL